MDRHNWYGGRVVLDTDLDETSDWILASFEGAATDYGFIQEDNSLNPEEKGGILRGLVVTQNGAAANLTVDVSVGACKDEAGQRISMDTAATLVLDYTGSWAVGATSGSATVSPVVVNPSSGQEVWVSLYLKYGELTSNPKTDLSGASVDFNIAESWQFELRAGTPGAPPATSQDALANGRVLLSDILIENPSGTIQLATNGICGSNDDLDTLGYGPDDAAALTGRRSDWIAAENASDFPAWRVSGTQNFEVREGNPRDALWTLLVQLAKQTSVAGAGIVGGRAQTGGAAAYLQQQAQSVTAGSVDSQVTELLQILSDAMMQGGANELRAQSGLHGLNCAVSDISDAKASITMEALGGGTRHPHRQLGMKYGHRTRCHELYDDFMVLGSLGQYPAQPGSPDAALPWGFTTNDDGEIDILDERGGVIQMQTGATPTINDYLSMMSGNSTSNWYWWHLGALPWGIFTVRVRVPTITTVLLRMGFWSDDPVTHADDAAWIEFNTTTHATEVYCYGRTSAGASAASSSIGTMDTGWNTYRLALPSTTTVLAQMNSGSWQVSGASGAARTKKAAFGIYLETLAGSERTVDVDFVDVADGKIDTDMYYT